MSFHCPFQLPTSTLLHRIATGGKASAGLEFPHPTSVPSGSRSLGLDASSGSRGASFLLPGLDSRARPRILPTPESRRQGSITDPSVEHYLHQEESKSVCRRSLSSHVTSVSCPRRRRCWGAGKPGKPHAVVCALIPANQDSQSRWRRVGSPIVTPHHQAASLSTAAAPLSVFVGEVTAPEPGCF